MSWEITTVPSFDELLTGGSIEQKFTFPAGKKYLLLEWLEFHLLRDPAHYFGPVLSLYYDTPCLNP